MSDPGAERLTLQVRRLSRTLRLRRALGAGTRGLFYGLLAALLLAAAAGTFPIPRPVLLACLAAAAGAGIGAAAGLLGRIDSNKLLIDADRRLGSRELIATGHELVAGRAGGASGTASHRGTFADAVIQDAADLLSRAGPARALGRLRPGLATYLLPLAVLVAAALVFPVDLRALLQRGASRSAELAMIGEDLKGLGERLQEASRAQDLGRRLALSEDLAQLGRDMADNSVTPDEALDRVSDLENRVAREYRLQLLDNGQAARPDGAGGERSGGQGSGKPGTGRRGSPGAQGNEPGSADPSANAGDAPDATDGNSKDLAGALDRLRQARDLLKGSQRSAQKNPQGGEGDGAGDKASPGQRQGNSGKGPGTGGTGGSGGQGGGMGGGQGGNGTGEGGGSGQDVSGGAPGTEPAQVKTGPPTSIARGTQGEPQRAQGNLGEGDTTSFLVRALPEWTGSKLPEGDVRRQYAQAAESALIRDEVPPALAGAVRDYFTNIGIPAGGAGQASGGRQTSGGRQPSGAAPQSGVPQQGGGQ